VTSRVYDTTVSLSGIHALINTKDFGFTMHPVSPPVRPTSVQLIAVSKPYPPVIYQVGSMNVNTRATLLAARSDFYTDLDMQDNGDLTYVRADVAHGSTPLFYAAMRYDTATLARTGSDIIPALDGHDYQVNRRGDVLYADVIFDTVSLSCLSGVVNDTGVAQTQRIRIKDSSGAIIFSWTPFTQDFSPCEMRYFSAGTYTAATPLDWSHFNSARWSNDSNIIVSFRYTGVFKINVRTGRVMWKLGGLDPSAIQVPDSIMYFSQHDFTQLADGRYAVYSDGDAAHKFMEALIYDIDEVNKTAQLSERFRSSDTTFSIAMGSYRRLGNLRFVNYGWYQSAVLPSSPPNLFCDMFDSTDHVIASLVSPYNQIPYRSIPTVWSPERLRPQILDHDTVLALDLPSVGRYFDIKWYDMPDDSSSVLIDSGLTLHAPIAGHQYVADAYIDSNSNLNWRITSQPYRVAGPTGIAALNDEAGIRLFPNPSHKSFHLINSGNARRCAMYNSLGMLIGDLYVKSGDNTYLVPEVRGVYFIYLLSSDIPSVYKLIVD
jgi:hypothetical protein